MAPRTTALHGSGLWQRIHAALDGSAKKSAAIAYLGSNAPVLLRSFCARDLLICDMSQRSLQSGATDPAAVRELIARDKANLDIIWPKDDSIEDAADLPAPDVIADQIAEELQAALLEITAIAADLDQLT